jgi:hypothetical protein
MRFFVYRSLVVCLLGVICTAAVAVSGASSPQDSESAKNSFKHPVASRIYRHFPTLQFKHKAAVLANNAKSVCD